MAKRTRVAAAERAAWRAQRPWPVAVLGIDPGTEVSGAGLVLPDSAGEDPDLRWIRSVDPYTLQLEQVVEDAVQAARTRSLGLVFVLEEWGTGGPMGIDSWLGLGAARGHWLRAARLAATRHPDVLTRSRLWCYAHIQTWRSWMDVPAIVVDENGKTVRRNEPEDWKKHATRRLAELCPRLRIDTADAAEAGLIALYGSRCDDVGKRLPTRLLAAHGLERPGARPEPAA